MSEHDKLMKMTTLQVIDYMAGGCRGTQRIVMEILYVDINRGYLNILNNLGIRGEKLNTFYNICCNDDLDMFQKTMFVINTGNHEPFSKNNILTNLNLPHPIPFVDENIEGPDFGEYGKVIMNKSELEKYRLENKMSFIRRLKSSLKNYQTEITVSITIRQQKK